MTTDDGALFDVPELRLEQRAGRAERALHAAAAAGERDGTLLPTDAALLAAALFAARALDEADRVGGIKGGYLIAQSLTGYREALHALRLPTAIAPGAVPLPTGKQSGTPSWVSDTFGTAE
jgi:hypothetical protein